MTGSAEGSLPGTEELVTRIWRAVLGTSDVDRATNFFSANGDSLQAMDVVVQVRQVLKKRVGLRDLFFNPVLGDFVAWLDDLPTGDRGERG
jgi:phosphopantetheine binding protein